MKEMVERSTSSEAADAQADRDYELRVAELEERKAARLSDDRHKRNELRIKLQELRFSRGRGLQLTAAQATVAAAIFALAGGIFGSLIQASTTREVEVGKGQTSLDVERLKNQGLLDLEREKFETGLIRAALSVQDEQGRIKNLQFFLKAGFIKDPQGIIANLKPQDYPSFASTFNQRSNLLERIRELSPAQALELAKTMESLLPSRQPGLRNAVESRDPQRLRLTSGDAAKTILEMWVVMDDQPNDWEKALGKLQGFTILHH